MIDIGNIIMKAIIGLAIVAAFVGGCSYLNKQFNLPDDNILEEAVEHQLENQTGIEVDLTPDTPEPK